MNNDTPGNQANSTNSTPEGAYIDGDVSTAGGDLTGRDKIISGDAVQGNKFMPAYYSSQMVINQYGSPSTLVPADALAGEQRDEDTVLIKITIIGDITNFSKENQDKFRCFIADLLVMNEKLIKIMDIRPGSIIVTIELPKAYVQELITLANEGKLKEFKVVNISVQEADLQDAELSEEVEPNQWEVISDSLPSISSQELKPEWLTPIVRDSDQLEGTAGPIGSEHGETEGIFNDPPDTLGAQPEDQGTERYRDNDRISL